MERDTVPLLDIQGFFSNDPSARMKVVEEVRSACLNCGFFMIQGHQANEEIIDTAWKVCILRILLGLFPCNDEDTGG